MRGIGGFVTQKKTVGPGAAEKAVGFQRSFSYGKRHGAIGPGSLDAAYNARKPLVGEPHILPSCSTKVRKPSA